MIRTYRLKIHTLLNINAYHCANVLYLFSVLFYSYKVTILSCRTICNETSFEIIYRCVFSNLLDFREVSKVTAAIISEAIVNITYIHAFHTYIGCTICFSFCENRLKIETHSVNDSLIFSIF